MGLRFRAHFSLNAEYPMNRAMLFAAVLFGAIGLQESAQSSPISASLGEPETPHNGEAQKELRQAQEAFNNRRFDDASKYLKAACAHDAALPPARLLLARMFLASNQRRQGHQLLEQAAAEAPNRPEVYLAFAEVALNEGRLTDALLHFDKVGRLAESAELSAEAKQALRRQSLLGKASIGENRRDWAMVKQALVAALELDPNNAPARKSLGRALYFLGEVEPAGRELQQAAKIDPTLEPARVTLGWLAARAGRQDEAAGWFRQSVETEPKRVSAHVAYATWLVEQGRVDDARTEAKEAERLKPDAPRVHAVLGLIARYSKDYPLAERYFEELHRKSPADFIASNQLVLVLADQEDADKRRRALELAQANARQWPNEPNAAASLGWACFREGRLEEAERYLRAASTSGQAAADTAYYLARVVSENAKPEELKALLKAAVEAPGLSAYREEARAWLKRLGEKS
jgi:tetratricopeptide (TPR) repeat protein